jgi:polysaccharide biosynthesis transport protein
MSFYQFYLAVKSRAKLVLFLTLAFFIVALGVSLVLPKNYTATTSMVINYKGIDPVTGLSMQAQLMPGFMATQMEIIASHAVALKVVKNLHLDEATVIQNQFRAAKHENTTLEDWLADLLVKGLKVKPSKESSIIEISYTGSDPQFSSAIANAFADAYQETSLRLKVEPSKKASEYLLSQAKVYRDKLESAQSKLSEYQQQSGLTSITENLDVENAKLNQVANQLIAARAQATESSSRQSSALSQGDSSPDIASNPIIQNLRMSLAQTSTKLAEVSNKYGVNHPQYLSVAAELDKLKAQLNLEISRLGASVSSNANIYSQSVAKLTQELATQKQKVLDLNRSRDQLSVLQRDVESAQLTFNTVNQRLNQTSIEGKANESDISILNPAIAPEAYSSPNVLINSALGIFLGLLFGILIAFVLEVKNRKIRSIEDLYEFVDIPVLALINNKSITNKKLNFFPIK